MKNSYSPLLLLFVSFLISFKSLLAEQSISTEPADAPDWSKWYRPADQPVFTTEHGNNHDPIIFVEDEGEFRYYLLISNHWGTADLWRAKTYSWKSEDWELVSGDYKIGKWYEYDDGVKVDGTYYIYEEGIVYTYTGDLAESNGKWEAAGTFPKDQCDDIGVIYEDDLFHIFGEHGDYPHGYDGTSLSHFTSKTGLGDWTLVNPKAVDPNPDGKPFYGVGDPSIIKINEEYMLFCDRESEGVPYRITVWKAPTLYHPFEFVGIAAEPRSDEEDDWDNHRVQDAEVAYIPELSRYVFFCNMMDTDMNPGAGTHGMGKNWTRVVGTFYSDVTVRKEDTPAKEDAETAP